MIAARATHAGISVEELRDRAAFAALSVEWERLRVASGARGPFLTPAWLAICATSLARELRLLVAHRGGRLVGAAPLMLERRNLLHLPARVLRSLSDDHSQRFDVLIAPEEPDAVAAALFAHATRMGGWDVMELRDVADGESGAARLAAAARACGHSIYRWPAARSPYLTLGDFEHTGTSKHRANIRRRRRNLEAALGPLTLERVDARDRALDDALDEGFALEAAGWKGDALSAIACSPELTRRYRALAHAFAARGELALYFLRAGTRRVAFHFALVSDGTYFLLKPGFDPSLSSHSPGQLLVDAVARDLEARGVRELDFLGEDMPWKRDWTEQARPQSWHLIFSRGPWGRVLFAWKSSVVPALKRLAKR
jgi:CelD/BcsL family acetyltransferase involved in cellulose biosynthesis